MAGRSEAVALNDIEALKKKCNEAFVKREKVEIDPMDLLSLLHFWEGSEES